MNVGKDVIRVLGSPTYICVLQRKDRKSIAITPCTAEHSMSFKVPDRLLTDGQCRMMINGIQFIQALAMSIPTQIILIPPTYLLRCCSGPQTSLLL